MNPDTVVVEKAIVTQKRGRRWIMNIHDLQALPKGGDVCQIVRDIPCPTAALIEGFNKNWIRWIPDIDYSKPLVPLLAELEYDKVRALTVSAPRPVDADFEQATKDLKKLPRPKKPKPPKK